ncbi:MAG: DUF3422 domain-containing protein [Planktomarina sp.]|nr:DUF3422 domain-containing protein [Planktomarina sp.]MDT2033695.1 DUF3422 domain-containing protein [Planktomarina sp.]MDT2040026.1 DUF3422 domain-containing protein [Planktomarina sp.]MDT2049952.1 DUF3422 domain-containing protein [Planktomarina sp.]|tara:strand:+ start:5690 stop:6970 length:1281 start_codon:yes stop_codon:yes gene_type:complete
MSDMRDHPMRFNATNELHARPFPLVSTSARAAFFAYGNSDDDAERSDTADWDHLIQLLDRFGAPHPAPNAKHYFGKLGKAWIKWERHAEFTTYTAIIDNLGKVPFDGSEFDVFPGDWLASMPGVRLTSAAIRIESTASTKTIERHLKSHFVAESLAVSRVLDNAAVIAGDYRIDVYGHLRFAVFVAPTTGRNRIGRIVQRLNEIEVYKTMSMLGLFQARQLSPKLSVVDESMSELVAALSDEQVSAEENLNALLRMSAKLESHSAEVAYRFAASKAYSAIVSQRIEVLREERFEGVQTFREFMMRRYDPSMRTVQAMDSRLQDLIARAKRTGDLLRTRVNVARQGQNQDLLSSMNRRADMQLRLQKTVEGLSIVAVSYYATGLALYLLAPIPSTFGIPKVFLTAAVVPVVVGAVYVALRRIRKNIN